MTSEYRRAGIRIAANYVRLFTVVCLGLALVRLLLPTIGVEGVGLTYLIGSTIGFAVAIEEIVGFSMIRELGTAHHGGDPRQFLTIYNSAVVVSAAAAVVTLGALAVILAVLPLLEISPGLLSAARWFVVAKGLETAVMVFCAPAFNMYLVLERMVAYNAWYVLRRGAMVIAATALFVLHPGTPAQGLIWYGWISCGLAMVFIVASVMMIAAADRRLIPRPALASRDGARAILGISGWNVGIMASQQLGLPAATVLMNLYFGLVYNTIFGFAMQMSGYTRTLTSGMTSGLDAVSARLSTTANGDAAGKTLQRLLYHSTRLHGAAAFPAAIASFILAEPILRVWVGSRIDSNGPEMHAAVVLMRILLIGVVAMCLSDNWWRVLYGAGHVHRYAPLVMIGGVVNLLLAIVLAAALPRPIRYTGVAWAFVATYLVVHMILVPRIGARVFEVRYRQMFTPLLRPLVAAALAAPLLTVFPWQGAAWNLWRLLVAGGGYGILYGAICWFLVLRRHERARLGELIGRFGLLRGKAA